MRKYYPILILLITLSTSVSHAQSWRTARVEAFGGITTLQYFGDIGGTPDQNNLLGLKDIDFGAIRPGIVLGARYQLQHNLHVKAAITSGLIAQSDVGSKNENRNYAFSTFINEFSAMVEYYIIPESDRNYFYTIMQVRGGLRHLRQPWSLYLTAGTGGTYFNVNPRENLATSPRFVDDKKLTVVLPFGAGVKYNFMPRMAIGFEILGRYTFTNYLDGFSPDAGKYNDVYYSGNIKFCYKITTTQRPAHAPRRRLFR